MTPSIKLCPFRCGELCEECSRDQEAHLLCRATGAAPNNVKAVLLYAPAREHVRDLLSAFGMVPGCTVVDEESAPCVRYRDLVVHFVFEPSSCTDLQRLHHGYYNMVLIDVRALCGHDEMGDEFLRRASCLLDLMDAAEDLETRYGFHRVMALVSAHDDDRADKMIAELAAKGIGRILRDRSECPRSSSGADTRRANFGRLVLDEMVSTMMRRTPGKRALCASGGGITGLYFEMGVLKCLDDCLDRGVQEVFDMFYGISAGAIVTGLLANGYTIDEGMASFAGHPGGRIPPVSLSLFRIANLDLADMRDRAAGLIRYLLAQLLRRNGDLSAENLLLQSGDLIGAPLRGDAFERILRDLFTRPGTSNDFRRLARPLYIGATDQDRRTHVLFGDKGHEDVPVSLAIQASFSLNPAFTSTLIRNRYYEDGAVTQTSNFGDAIKKGADFIFIIDPLVPYVSKKPGYARRRGFLYNADQDIRTLTYTRFEQYRNVMLRRHTQVSSYTFLPANRLRGLMSMNPMDHRPFLAIWRAAYLSTLQRIEHLKYRMCGDLAVHGVTLDTARAEEVAARLRAADAPTLADFFPNGRVELRLPRDARAPRAAVHDVLSPGVVPVPQTTAA